jgi:uncharacterized protein YukE
MPIPFILLGAAAVAAGYGVVKGAGGVADMMKAKKIGEEAEQRHKRALANLESRRKDVNRNAEEYGRLLLVSRKETLGRFVGFVEKLGQRASKRVLQALKEIDIDAPKLDQFKAASLEAAKVLGGAVGSVSAGASAGVGTMALVGLLGTASTGTAISTLSGVVATNATLAWLGGGAIAAGGGGMALGTIVLGGIVFAPAALVTGFVLAGQGEKALTKARKYQADVNVDIKKMDGMKVVMSSIITRINELRSLLQRLDRRANEALDDLERLAFDPHDDEHIQLFQKAGLLTNALAEIMRTPVIDRQGNVTAQSHNIQAKYRDLAD